MPEQTEDYEYVETPMHGKTMTVGALRDALIMFDQSLPVITEGCDCYGDAFKVSLESSGKEHFVLIEREPPEPSTHPIRQQRTEPQHPDLL